MVNLEYNEIIYKSGLLTEMCLTKRRNHVMSGRWPAAIYSGSSKIWKWLMYHNISQKVKPHQNFWFLQRITTLLFLLIIWISFSYLRAKIPPSKEISEVYIRHTKPKLSTNTSYGPANYHAEEPDRTTDTGIVGHHAPCLKTSLLM